MTRPTIAQIVNNYVQQQPPPEVLIVALIEREQHLMDVLALVAQQHGVHPPIFAKVIADLGLGTPKTDEERTFIDRQFEEYSAMLIAEMARTLGVPENRIVMPPTDIPEGE